MNRRHQDAVREKIRCSEIIRHLQKFAVSGEVYNGREWSKEWDPAKVAIRMKVHLGLLNKALPDLRSTELTTDPDRPFGITVIERHVVDPKA